MDDNRFFDKQTRASSVKAEIVSKYFLVWAKIIRKSVSSIGYVDLFAGAGRYGDGQPSTPLLILTRAIAEPTFANSLHAVLSERDPATVEALRTAVAELPNASALTQQPIISCDEVSEKTVEWFTKTWRRPSLVFLDPWGYKELSVQLIHAALRSHRFTDVIFFFNYNRVNAALTNTFMADHINSIFGTERAAKLRLEIQGATPEKREELVIGALKEVVTLKGKYFWQEFRFTSPDVDKTSHYIALLTKHPAGLGPMKDIMAKLSSEKIEGVPSMSYAPKAAEANRQMSMFTPSPIDNLGKELLVQYAKRALTLEQLFNSHHQGTRFVIANYRSAVLRLENAGQVTCEPSANERPLRDGSVTLAEWVLIRFP